MIDKASDSNKCRQIKWKQKTVPLSEHGLSEHIVDAHMCLSTRLLRNLENLATLVMPTVRAGAMRKFALTAVVAVDKRDGAELVVNTAAITPTFGCLSLWQRAHSRLLLVHK